MVDLKCDGLDGLQAGVGAFHEMSFSVTPVVRVAVSPNGALFCDFLFPLTLTLTNTSLACHI